MEQFLTEYNLIVANEMMLWTNSGADCEYPLRKFRRKYIWKIRCFVFSVNKPQDVMVVQDVHLLVENFEIHPTTTPDKDLVEILK